MIRRKLTVQAKSITINKIDSCRLTGNASAVVNTYSVIQDGREFLITCTIRFHGTSVSMVGESGILYVNSEDHLVHRQNVALSGACGLNTDDEVVNGLSCWVLRGITLAERNTFSGEIKIISDADSAAANPVCFVDGVKLDSIDTPV